MPCGCGGSNNARVQELRERRIAAARAAPQQGPKASGYTWDGPKGATVTAPKPAQATAK